MSDLTKPLLRWLAAHDLPQRVTLLCEDTAVPGDGRDAVLVRVPGCVADLTVGLPAQVLAWGVPEVAVVPCTNSGTDVRHRVAQWRETIPSGIELLEEPPAPRRWRRAPEVITLGAVPVSRRVIIGFAALDQYPLDLETDETARTLTALDILRDRGQAVPEPIAEDSATEDEPVESSPARDLLVEGCTACGVCVQACPHDALSLTHHGVGSTLTHTREVCHGELACMRLCPVNAISDGGSLPLHTLWQEPRVTLSTVGTTTCPRCRARHTGPEGSRCPACEFRSRNAFGSSLPPGAIAQLAARNKRPKDT